MPVSKNRRNKSGKSRTLLSQHIKKGKSLRPAFSQLEQKIEGKLLFSNWTYERLPEMLWAVIIRTVFNQSSAINHFKKILSLIRNHRNRENIKDISITGLSELEESFREDLIKIILSDPIVANSLTILKLFPSLPAKDSWYKFLPSTPPNIDLLMKSVGNALFHQSQESTDCRWLRIMALVSANKIHMPDSILEELLDYPNVGDQRHVRPTIRAMEMTFSNENNIWSKQFWDECWQHTPCLTVPEEKSDNTSLNSDFSTIDLMKENIIRHWESTHQTTEIDAKHDCVFGIILFSLEIISECIKGNLTSGILGRLTLRNLLENHITLRYLTLKNDQDLWSKWRKYGAGQAKLNALRFDEGIIAPKYINEEALEIIASEDTWEEFLDIELGNWTNLDLRKLSLESELKEQYDKYYSWTSGFSHSNWGAIRETEFSTCSNPLHRLHRIPHKNTLPSVKEDLEILFNHMVEDMMRSYPGFLYRLEL